MRSKWVAWGRHGSNKVDMGQVRSNKVKRTIQQWKMENLQVQFYAISWMHQQHCYRWKQHIPFVLARRALKPHSDRTLQCTMNFHNRNIFFLRKIRRQSKWKDRWQKILGLWKRLNFHQFDDGKPDDIIGPGLSGRIDIFLRGQQRTRQEYRPILHISCWTR